MKKDTIEALPATDAQLAQLEALLFVSCEPLSLEKLRAHFQLDSAGFDALVAAFRQELARSGRGLQLLNNSSGLQLATREELHPALESFYSRRQKIKLTFATLETLAIIAYRQPITLAEVSQMRGGVNSASSLRNLMQKRLVKIGGRKKLPGNPALYVTTREFLEYFNLDNLEELPSVEELSEIITDREQVSFLQEEV